MLIQFLHEHKAKILAQTEQRFSAQAGIRPSSDLLRQGLPIFLEQLLELLAHEDFDEDRKRTAKNKSETALKQTAAQHGIELQRLGYTLSHVITAYGALCESITSLAAQRDSQITANEFHNLNRSIDMAISSAVTNFQSQRTSQDRTREIEQMGCLAHELRNALNTVNFSFNLIKEGTVGPQGNISEILARGLKRMDELIGRSLTEVRLQVDPEVHLEDISLLQMVDQIALTAGLDARSKNQVLEINIDPSLTVEADQQLLYSALSNLIQNAIKYSHKGSKIDVRGNSVGNKIIIEVEDECGGLTKKPEEIFRPFVQANENRSGVGLGLSIVQRAVILSRGEIEVLDLPGRGCIFRIILPYLNP